MWKLKNRGHRFWDLTSEEFLNDENAIKTIATEYDKGPIAPSGPPTDSQIKPTSFGNKVAVLIDTPFLSSLVGIHEIKGEVVDHDTSNPIANAIVRLYRTMLRLSIPMFVFSDASTSSTKLNSGDELPKGDYPVLEIRLNHPNRDTDYVKIRFGNNEGWICSKWKGSDGKFNHSALLFDERVLRPESYTAATGSFSIHVNEMQKYTIRLIKKNYFDGEEWRFLPDEDAIEIRMEPSLGNVQEKDIIKRLHEFKDYEYDLNNPKFPWKLWETMTAIAPPKQNNCITFAEGLLVRSWQVDNESWLDTNGNAVIWSNEEHAKWAIYATHVDRDTRDEPVKVLVDKGMAVDLKLIEGNDLPKLRERSDGSLTVSGVGSLVAQVTRAELFDVIVDVPDAQGSGSTLDVTIEQADSTGGAYSALVKFPQITDAGRYQIQANSNKKYIRAKWTTGGPSPNFSEVSIWISILPKPWSIVQGYKNPSSSISWALGHNFIIIDMHPETGRVLTLEANANVNMATGVKIGDIYKMDGPGFREIGDIDDFNFKPPEDWWKDENLKNWDDMKNNYPYIYIARLKVYDCKWVGGKA